MLAPGTSRLLVRRSAVGLVALLLGLSAVSGCVARSAPEAEAVVAYATALVPALSAETLDPLRAAATDGQAERVQLYVSMWTGQGIRVAPTLSEIAVTRVDRTDDSAVVETSERWRMAYSDGSGVPVGVEEYTLKVSYTVVRLDGVWRVSDVEEHERAVVDGQQR